LILSVVIPATDEPSTLDRCIAAARDAMRPQDELIVVRGPAGAGPAEARNAGARNARGDALVFVDADVVVAPDALRRIARTFAEQPDLDALFGGYDERPEAPGVISRFRNLLHHHVHAAASGPAETFWAGLGAIRREAFERSGGFDARRYPRPAIEDIELGRRLRALGLQVVLDPRVRGTHLKAWTLRSMVTTDFARRGIPWTRLQIERRELAGTLNLAPSQRLAAAGAAAALAGLVARRPLVAAGGAATMVALNRALYGGLLRSGGPRLVAAAVPLHAVHYATAAVSVPAGVAAHLLASLRRGHAQAGAR
jgi:GT2 family glycosyltransferase